MEKSLALELWALLVVLGVLEVVLVVGFSLKQQQLQQCCACTPGGDKWQSVAGDTGCS